METRYRRSHGGSSSAYIIDHGPGPIGAGSGSHLAPEEDSRELRVQEVTGTPGGSFGTCGLQFRSPPLRTEYQILFTGCGYLLGRRYQDGLFVFRLSQYTYGLSGTRRVGSRGKRRNAPDRQIGKPREKKRKKKSLGGDLLHDYIEVEKGERGLRERNWSLGRPVELRLSWPGSEIGLLKPTKQ